MTVEILTVEEMSRADGLAVKAGVPSLDLMEAAGKSVASEIRRRWPRRPVAVLCGPGNNGGDGFVIARLLKQRGWPVRVGLLGDIGKLKGDAQVNAKEWHGEIEAMTPSLLDGAELIVDALFGAGLTRDIDGAALAMVDEINRRHLDCVAVDVPSGVDGNTGEIRGRAPKSAITVTFFRKKPGHLLNPGADYCGDIFVGDIGIPEAVLENINSMTAENGPECWGDKYPWPNSASHKYSRGHALILGGSEMTGAARLAARAARRAGAGMVTIAAPSDAVAIYRAGDPGNIVIGSDQGRDIDDLLADKKRNAALIGPGAGVSLETQKQVIQALRSEKPVVLDADGISAFEDNPDDLFSWIKGPCVLTPHEGEFKRIFSFQGDRLSTCRAASTLSGAVILFKGADTVIAAPDGRAVINTTGTPDLATAGSGDVLAGIIVGLLAQGMDAFEAAAAGAWLHGRASEEFGAGLIAEDLAEILPRVLAELKKHTTSS